eukprot:scaffold506353_cov59-Attheya_sp.AAC.1
MPTRVTLWVKRSSPLVHPIPKKRRTNDLRGIRVKSETVNAGGEVPVITVVETEEIDDGSVASDHGASESALCEPSSDPHLSHSAITNSSITSNQCTSQGGNSDNTEMVAFESTFKGDLDSLSNQDDSESPPTNNVFSELQREEELEFEEEAQSSTAHGSAAILNNKKRRKCQSWDENFKELVDFKAIKGHMNVPQGSGPLGRWVSKQRRQYRRLKEGKPSPLTTDRGEQLERIGFELTCRPTAPWDERFEELVDFKKIKGHTNVPQGSGQLGTWVNHQRTQYRLLKEGKASPLTSDRGEQLESIGLELPRRRTGPPWDERFEELVDFKKIKGHMNVPQGSGPLGRWVSDQRHAFRRLKEGKASPLTSDRREKLESIEFELTCRPTGAPWDERFEELVDFKKTKGHMNVPQGSGPLGRWVNHQRTQYHRLLKEGIASALITDRGEQLESIGFELTCRRTDTPWDKRFEELVDFKKTKGHTNVPRGFGPLGRWVTRQRTQYRLLKEGKASPLTSDRGEQLERIGFELPRRRTCAPWGQRFEELVDFKKINGHTNVPRGFGQLGTWVNHQRTQYHLLKEGKASPLTSDRCEQLEIIGFELTCRRTAPWDERFEELVDFKKIKGHMNVPQGTGPLGNWVNRQKQTLRLLKEGKASPLTSDRGEQLESIGFGLTNQPTGSTWDQRFEELVDFKKIKGHTNVPRGSGQLGTWVDHQRTQYRLLREGKSSPLTSYRREKLESIGFRFNIYKKTGTFR